MLSAVTAASAVSCARRSAGVLVQMEGDEDAKPIDGVRVVQDFLRSTSWYTRDILLSTAPLLLRGPRVVLVQLVMEEAVRSLAIDRVVLAVEDEVRPAE